MLIGPCAYEKWVYNSICDLFFSRRCLFSKFQFFAASPESFLRTPKKLNSTDLSRWEDHLGGTYLRVFFSNISACKPLKIGLSKRKGYLQIFRGISGFMLPNLMDKKDQRLVLPKKISLECGRSHFKMAAETPDMVSSFFSMGDNSKILFPSEGF